MKDRGFVAELLVYLSVALYGVHRALLAPGHVVGEGPDLPGTLWFTWWTGEQLLGGGGFGRTTLFFHPLGKDVFAHTGSNVVDALLAQPFVVLFGFPDFQPVYVLAVLLANVLAFRALALHVLPSRGAAFAASLAWMLNPLVLFELTAGRLTQGFLVFLPLALLHFLRAHEGRRHAVLAGVFTALQGYVYWFSGYALAFGLAWLATVALWTSRERAVLVKRYLLAGAVAVVGVLPAVVPMVLKALDGAVPGLGEAVGIEGQFLGLDELEKKAPAVLLTWGTGVPLLAWAVVGPGRTRWLPFVLGLGVLGCGPDVWLPDLRLPSVVWTAATALPFFERLWFPYRLFVVGSVGVALGVGFLASRWRHGWVLGLAVAAATLVEQGRLHIFPFATQDAEPPEVMRWLAQEHGGGILTLPFGEAHDAVLWQPSHGLPLFGGMGEGAETLWPPGYQERLDDPLVDALLAIPDHPRRAAKTVAADALEAFVDDGFRWVVLDREPIEPWARGVAEGSLKEDDRAMAVKRLSVLLGPPTAVGGAWVVWDLWGRAVPPEHLAATDEHLAAPFEEDSGPPIYDQALAEEGRHRFGASPNPR